jgi:hypothetical protein
MTYVVIGILFVLVVGGAVTAFVMMGTRNSSPATAEDQDAAAAPFSGPDHTPAGDTAQHAGQQDGQGRTVTPNDASDRGGTGAPTSGPHAAGHKPSQDSDEPPGGRYKRDPVGGEGEGEPAIGTGQPPHPGERQG